MTTPSVDEESVPLESILKQVLDRACDAIAVYTAQEWVIASVIVYANRALCELSGYEEEHFVGHSALLLAGARPDVVTLESILPPAGAHELRRRAGKQRPDGSTYLVDVEVTPLTDARGNVTHYLSRQRQVEASLRAPAQGPHVSSRPPFAA
jgi:PAS domain S-box-containing protein